MQYEEKTLQRNEIYQGKILTLRRDEVLLHDGKTAIREIVDHHGGACVLYRADGKFVFVRQFRYAYGEEVLEIPAGKLEEGENPKAASIRELEEETGVRVTDATLLFVVYPSPGYTNEKIHVYYAENGENVAKHLDEGEFLDTVWIEEERVKNMLDDGEFKDAKTLIALQAYFARKG